MSRFSKLEFESDNDGELRPRLSGGGAPKDAAFYMSEAQAAFEEGDFERALQSYSRVLEFDSRNPAAWTGQVRMLVELGEFREAKVWADKGLEAFPHEPDLLAAKAVALARTGDLKAAMAFSDASFEERGHTPYMWIARADVLLARQETRADFCFEKALSSEPGNWFIRWLIARVEFYYNRFVVALKMAQDGLVLDATRAVLWLQAGRCQQQLGLISAASESIDRALQLNPKYTEASAAMITISTTGFGGWLQGRLRQLFSP